MTPISIVAYLTLFAAVAVAFLLVSLLLGRLLRAQAPSPEKLAPYECGEPAVGSALVQFDLRFYVVALVFIIFEVEVALFFPPATIFGKATQLMDRQVSPAKAEELCRQLGADNAGGASARSSIRQATRGIWPSPPAPLPMGEGSNLSARNISPADARLLALAVMADLGLFFAVILVGFAYVWWRGDLDWVRAFGPPGADLPNADLRPSADLRIVQL
jgi:NADH-quinone oxidoreductase subunit A